MPLLQPQVSPHPLSPRRPVPAAIERPHYVDVPQPREDGDVHIKNAETIEKMRIASRIAATAMVEAAKAIAPGVTTDELDAVAHEYMLDHGAYPSPLGYKGFPKSVCTSVNEVICHGIPDARPLEDGDIVNIDVTAFIHGVHGDTDATYLVGDVDEESRLLVERTHEAMMRGIRAARPGREINVIGRVIEPGMTFTVEPMLNLGTHEWEMWEDRWTVVTRDRRRSAQFEHTIVITDDGNEILTLPEDDAA